LLAGDITVFGRSARGERLSCGLVLDRWEVRREGRLIWTDTMRLGGDLLASIDHPAGFDGGAGQALILFQGPQAEEHRDAIRAVAQAEEMLAGITLIDGLLLARLLDRDAARLRQHFAKLWSALRPGLGRQGHTPRHWRF
jgi:urease accessory protein